MIFADFPFPLQTPMLHHMLFLQSPRCARTWKSILSFTIGCYRKGELGKIHIMSRAAFTVCGIRLNEFLVHQVNTLFWRCALFSHVGVVMALCVRQKKLIKNLLEILKDYFTICECYRIWSYVSQREGSEGKLEIFLFSLFCHLRWVWGGNTACY